MVSSLEQVRRRRRLNQQIRELIAVRRAVGRAGGWAATADAEPSSAAGGAAGDPADPLGPTSAAA